MFGENIELWIGLDDEVKEMAEAFGETLKDGKYLTGQKIDKNDRTTLKHIIWLREFDWSIHHQAMLLHELLHLTYSVLEGLGFTLASQSEEIYTYYPQTLYGKILYEISKKVKGKIKL